MTDTTDPQHELFDILDEHGRPTGQVKTRGMVHRDGDWHRGLHVWVYGFTSVGTPFILFQRRSMSKDTWPGKLDLAVGGHFSAGESLADTLRETEEEIGLTATVDELIPLGQRFIEDVGATYIDRELDEVYALRSDLPLDAYVQHPEEVDGVLTIDLRDLHLLFSGRQASVNAHECRRNGTMSQVTVHTDDFAGDREDYRDAVVASIQQLVDGMRPEPFLIRG